MRSIITMMKSRRMRWAGHATCTVDKRTAYRMLAGRPEGNRLLRDQKVGGWIILRCVLERYGVVWTGVAQDRDKWRALVNSVMSLQIPEIVRKFLSSCTTDDFS
jgi:hypothetical protein